MTQPWKQCDHIGHNDAEALALSCIDFRLVDTTVSQLEQGCNAPFDYTALPGASLYVIRPERPNWKSTFLQTLQIARDIHHIQGCVIVNHADCGMFRATFPYLIDPKTGKIPYEVEKQLVKDIQKRTKLLIRELHPDLYFRGYWINLNGEMELLTAGRPII